jgi:hypothetical protein
LNSESEDFEIRLHAECQRLKATMGFDAVCGEMTGIVLPAMIGRITNSFGWLQILYDYHSCLAMVKDT